MSVSEYVANIGPYNSHLDNPADTPTSQFLSSTLSRAISFHSQGIRYLTTAKETDRRTLKQPANIKFVSHFQNNRTCRQIPSHGSPHFLQFTQFSPVSLMWTALHRNSSFYTHDHLISAIRSQKVSCLCLLYLSAAFDTVDILITRLSSWFGIHGSVLSWFMSYLSSRWFHVKCETDLSPGTHTPALSALSPMLWLVQYSSSCTPLP